MHAHNQGGRRDLQNTNILNAIHTMCSSNDVNLQGVTMVTKVVRHLTYAPLRNRNLKLNKKLYKKTF